MKKLLSLTILSLLGFTIWYSFPVLGETLLSVPRGGTGTNTFTTGECLKGNGTGAITTGACGTGTGSGFSTTSADFWFIGQKNPFTLAYLTSTSTATSTYAGGLRITGGLSTTQGISAPFFNATSTTATSTLQGLNIASGGLIVSGLTGIPKITLGVVGNATAGTDYENALTFSAPLLRTTNAISLLSTFSTTSLDWYLGATTTDAFTMSAIRATSTSISSTFATPPTFTTLTSALVLTGAGGLTAEYAGATCSNQFVRSLSALGAATCATVGAADVSLANLTATDASLTFSGTYTGATARTIGLNVANANTWSALQTFTNTGTTTFSGGLINKTIGAFPILDIGWFVSTSTTATSTIAGGLNLQTNTGGSFNVGTTSGKYKFTVSGDSMIAAPSGQAASSTIYIFSTAANKGGSIIIEDSAGGACTEISTKAGAIISTAVTCPTIR